MKTLQASLVNIINLINFKLYMIIGYLFCIFLIYSLILLSKTNIIIK